MLIQVGSIGTNRLLSNKKLRVQISLLSKDYVSDQFVRTLHVIDGSDNISKIVVMIRVESIQIFFTKKKLTFSMLKLQNRSTKTCGFAGLIT